MLSLPILPDNDGAIFPCSKRPDLHVFKEFTKRSRLAVVVDSFMARLPRTAVLKRSKDKAWCMQSLDQRHADNSENSVIYPTSK